VNPCDYITVAVVGGLRLAFGELIAHSLRVVQLIGRQARSGLLCLAAYQWPRLRRAAGSGALVIARLQVGGVLESTFGTILPALRTSTRATCMSLYGFSRSRP